MKNTNKGGNPPPDQTDPCNLNNTIANGVLLCSFDEPGHDGWEPEDPYFSLTDNDKSQLDLMEMEDKMADKQSSVPSPCHGTARLGNKNFQGTVEHWLIQLDYSTKNPLYGEREYAIPGAGASGGYGYADIVNIGTKEMFEIKPSTQIAAGQLEIANYVVKANLNCPTNGSPWIEGLTLSYPLTYLTQSKRSIEASCGPSDFAGSIIYYSSATSILPNPIVIPQSISDEIKNVINKLKQFPSLNSYYEIQLFLNNNPDVAQFIQTAALGAAISIIVANILEDVVNALSGVVDDIASFMLAYRLVRIALL